MNKTKFKQVLAFYKNTGEELDSIAYLILLCEKAGLSRHEQAAWIVAFYRAREEKS